MSTPLEHDALALDRALWPADGGPDRCEICGSPADPRAVAATAYACTEHANPADLEDDTERLTVDDLRTIQQVMIERADEHRRVCRRLERADVIARQSRVAWILEHHEAIARYERIAARVGREILELEWEV